MRRVVCRLDEFAPGSRKIVKVGGRSIGVFRIGDRFFALRNRCPHQGGPLCFGRLFPWATSGGPGDVVVGEGPAVVACPWHGWEFELETGQSFLGPADTRVKRYRVTVSPGASIGGGLLPAEEEPIPASVEPVKRIPGPYVAERFSVYVDAEYVVIDA